MISNKSIKVISIILFVGFLIFKLFGKYLVLPIWDTLYTVNVIPLDIKTHLMFAIEPVISLIIPICYAIFLFKYSKLLDTNPFLWATLGLIKGPLAIVLFLLTLIIHEMNNSLTTLKLNYKRIVIWTFLLILLGIVFASGIKAVLTPFYTYFLSPEIYQQYFMLTRIDKTTFLIYSFLINIGIAIWISNETKKMKLFPILWTIFGLVGGFIAPILLYIYKIILLKNGTKYSS